MFPQSIRWRLPLTYAGIAFIAAVILGVALLATLRGYYDEREQLHLADNAQVIRDSVTMMQASQMSEEEIAAQLRSLAFITQARVRVLNEEETVIADSGSPATILSIGGVAVQGAVKTPFEQQITSDLWINSTEAAQGVPPLSVQLSAGGGNQEDTVMFAVSSTPYGFDLAGEVTPGAVSDQIVRLPLSGTVSTLSGYIELSEGASFGSHIVGNVATALLFAGVIAVVIAALIGWFVSRQITDPLLALTNGAESMARGRLNTRVHLNERDEFGTLANTFNEMAAQVEATITALRRFVADAAHELHTPLTALHADLELAATEADPDRQTDYVRRAYAQVRRLESLTDNLLNLSRIESKTRSAPFRRINIVPLIGELSESYASRAEQVGVNFTVNIPDASICVEGDDMQLRRAVGNLLDNAIKFTPEGGTVNLSVICADNRVNITVNDTGIGIPIDDLPQLFSRFHRGRNANTYPGSGLGLAIIRAIADVHHGDISVQSAPGSTRFTLQLPAAS